MRLWEKFLKIRYTALEKMWSNKKVTRTKEFVLVAFSISERGEKSNAIKLRKSSDDCCDFKVHRFEGSKVLLLAHIILALSEYVRGLRTLRTFSNILGLWFKVYGLLYRNILVYSKQLAVSGSKQPTTNNQQLTTNNQQPTTNN